MPKPFPKTETEIVMSVDRDAGVLDLRVFAPQHKRAEVVGTATLRMADVSEVVRLLSEFGSRICCWQENPLLESQRG